MLRTYCTVHILGEGGLLCILHSFDSGFGPFVRRFGTLKYIFINCALIYVHLFPDIHTHLRSYIHSNVNKNSPVTRHSCTCTQIFVHLYSDICAPVPRYLCTCTQIFVHLYPDICAPVPRYSCTCVQIFIHQYTDIYAPVFRYWGTGTHIFMHLCTDTVSVHRCSEIHALVPRYPCTCT